MLINIDISVLLIQKLLIIRIIKSTAKTLYHQKTKLPTKRYEELKATFLSYYPENTELTDALLEEAMELKTTYAIVNLTDQINFM